MPSLAELRASALNTVTVKDDRGYSHDINVWRCQRHPEHVYAIARALVKRGRWFGPIKAAHGVVRDNWEDAECG